MSAVETERDGYRITTDTSELDVAVVHAFLSTSYWAESIPLHVLHKSMTGSLCFGVLQGDQTVGFCRVVTDRATFAYLMDVFVLQEHRGQGLGQWMMRAVLAHSDLQGLRKFMLATRDAHQFYESLGFKALAQPELLMEIATPDVYKPR